MEHFAQGIVAGFAVSATIPAMYYFNKAALATLFAVNKAIGKALGHVLLLPPETRSLKDTCNDKNCPIDGSCPCDGFHCICYNCDSEKLEPKP